MIIITLAMSCLGFIKEQIQLCDIGPNCIVVTIIVCVGVDNSNVNSKDFVFSVSLSRVISWHTDEVTNSSVNRNFTERPIILVEKQKFKAKVNVMASPSSIEKSLNNLLVDQENELIYTRSVDQSENHQPLFNKYTFITILLD